MRNKATIILSVAAVLTALFVLTQNRGPDTTVARSDSTVGDKGPRIIPLSGKGPQKVEAPDRALHFAPSMPRNRPAIATEVMYSTDVRATYDKYKSAEDPSGEISYFLFKALDDCTPFAGRTPGQIAQLMNVRQQPIESASRTRLIRESVERCKEFASWDHSALIVQVEELRQKAARAGYPAAVATTLPRLLWTKGAQYAEEVAISLLSGDVDGDVVQGIYQYLLARNGNEWFAEQGDPAASIAAWTLLECNMGAECGARGHPVITACLFFGACDQHDVITVLPIMNPALDPERLQEAIEIETNLGNAIRNRDWVRLGFTYPRKRPDPKS
jgi:hypothetical protein